MFSDPAVGMCEKFCPDSERERRTKMKLLHVLEKDVKGHQSSGAHVVKEYVRAGAGHEVPPPDQLRPAPLLMETMLYLVRLLDNTMEPWHVIYEFVSNRIQAIRQDITFQQLEDINVTRIYEMAARFHLYAQIRLWECPLRSFDPKLNTDNLQQCLIKVIKSDVSSSTSREEFEAYHILTNLGNTDVLNRALSLGKSSRSYGMLDVCIEISLSFMMNNYVRCGRLISKLPPLHRAAVWPQLQHIHRRALKTMCTAYSCSNASLPIKTLLKWLLLEESQEGFNLCCSYGIAFDETSIFFKKNVFRQQEKVFLVAPKIAELGKSDPSSWVLNPCGNFN